MQAILNQGRSIGFLVNVNWDRIFYFGTVLVALLAGTWVGTLGIE